MRIFYENYQKLRYWHYQEDVYQKMVGDPFFISYGYQENLMHEILG